GAPNSHLFPVDEYKHELLSSFLLRGLLGRGELFLLFRHVMILVGKCHIKSRRSGAPGNPAGRHSWTSVPSRILRSPTSALEKIRSRSWTSAVDRETDSISFVYSYTATASRSVGNQSVERAKGLRARAAMTESMLPQGNAQKERGG